MWELSLFSTRFGKEIVITAHAEARLGDRDLSQDQLFDIIEHGTIHKKDEKRMWISMEIADRGDNLLCAAIVVEDRLVIKTVMVNWELVE